MEERLTRQFVYGYDEESLEEHVGKLLLERGLQLGTAESCTGGNIGRLITSVPGSSAYYRGGVVAYSNELKHILLDVPEATIEAEGAVSEATARAMVAGACRRLGVDVAAGRDRHCRARRRHGRKARGHDLDRRRHRRRAAACACSAPASGGSRTCSTRPCRR